MTKLVHIDFVLDGLTGRETYMLDVDGYEVAIAHGLFEVALIETGFPVFDCGCCADDDGTRLTHRSATVVP